jgi:hypothetical protein
MMRYRYRGRTVPGLDAQTCGEELERIRAANDGRLTTEGVLEGAQPEEAPLHPAFTWDDARAAHLHRLREARELVRSVRLYTDESGEDEPAYMHVHLEAANEEEAQDYYQSARVARDNPLEWMAVIQELTRRLQSTEAALADAKRIASNGDDPTRVEQLTIVAQALALARETVQRMH